EYPETDCSFPNKSCPITNNQDQFIRFVYTIIRNSHMELGLCTFADMLPDKTGSGVNAHQRIKDLLEEIKLADELGLDVFGVGEHHRPDYSVSAPSIILAAAASITKNIKLSSAVTV